jgi:glycosyltransferase involved in cell wall biosynthesis
MSHVGALGQALGGKARFDLEREGSILYMSAVDVSLPNGPGVNEREFLLEFCRVLGDRAHVLIPRPRTPLDEFAPYAAQIYYAPPARSLGGRLVSHLWRARTAGRLIDEGKVDFVVTRLEAWSADAYLTLRRRRVPYAIKTLGNGPFDGLRRKNGVQSWIVRLLAPLQDRMRSQLLRGAVMIDAVTPALRDRAVRDGGAAPTRVVVVENATNTKRFFPVDARASREAIGIAHLDPVIGFVGGRPWERGGAQMVEVAARLKGDYPGIGVVVVGGGEGMRPLADRAESLGLAGHYHFAGVVPYSDVPRYVNCFDVGIALPRPSRLSTVGNSNQKVRQYLACGRPVITAGKGAEFLEHEGIGTLIDPTDIDALEFALRRWLSLSPADKATVSQQASEYARKYLSVGSALRRRLELWSEAAILSQDSASRSNGA